MNNSIKEVLQSKKTVNGLNIFNNECTTQRNSSNNGISNNNMQMLLNNTNSTPRRSPEKNLSH